MQSQYTAILSHLKKGGTLTALDALKKFSCFRLSARILEMRRDGHSIRSVFVEKVKPDGSIKRFKKYSLT